MYVYSADLWCDDHGQEIKEEIDSLFGYTQTMLLGLGLPVEKVDGLTLWRDDSNWYPIWGPDDQESDFPDHCAHCHVPLGSALTTDGVEYVFEAIKEELDNNDRWQVHECYNGTWYEGSPHIAIIYDWVETVRGYSLTDEQEALIEAFDQEWERYDEMTEAPHDSLQGG